MTSIPTLQGGELAVSLRNDLPYVNDSQIIITDIQAKNGVIHVIDAVLVPDVSLPETPDVEETASATTGSIVDIAVANGNFLVLM
jgi:hypothetical protein